MGVTSKWAAPSHSSCVGLPLPSQLQETGQMTASLDALCKAEPPRHAEPRPDAESQWSENRLLTLLLPPAPV